MQLFRVLKGVFRKKVLFSRVTFAELKIQVTKIEPGLSAE
ncbi:MAG: hypothetical protein ACI92C_001463, partial [Neolewinella sp.]